MSVMKVECPKCRQPLRMPQALPAGVEVRCPGCQTVFRIAAQSATQGPASAPPSGPAEKKAPVTSASMKTPTTASLAATAQATGSRSARAIAVAAVLALVVAGGSTLVYFLFRERGGPAIAQTKLDPESENSGGTPPDIPEPEIKVKQSPKSVGKKALIALSAEDEKTALAMIAKGVAWLKQGQNPDGAWSAGDHPYQECVAFGGLTLLECGVPAHDPAIVKAAGFVRQASVNMTRTYGLALYVLFLSKLNEAADQGLIQHLTMRLVAGQNEHGGWSYECPALRAGDAETLVEFCKDLGRRSIADYVQAKPEAWQNLPEWVRDLPSLKQPMGTPFELYRRGDNSNTQFAALALWAARRQKLPVERALDLVVTRFRNSQNADGSWSYEGQASANPLPTMTCAGLLGMAIGYGLLPAESKLAPLKDPAIQKALANLGPSIGSASRDPTPAMTDLYFLWSIERVGVLFQLAKIDGKDWYQWGFRMLRQGQANDGSWFAGKGHQRSAFPDTCFALLFLQRANLAQDLTDKLTEALAAAAPRLDGTKQD